MITKRSAALLALALVFATLEAEGAVRRLVDVRYQRSDGSKSRPEEAEVTFITGEELNEKTTSFRYRIFSVYGLIWFDNDEVAIIELKSVLPASSPLTNDDFKNFFSLGQEVRGRQVNDKYERTWYFQAKRLFQWIDPRVER